MKTTLNTIRAHSPCRAGWEKLLLGLSKTRPDDDPLWIDEVLDISGLDDALWCLRAVDGCDREIRLYAVWCARRAQHHMPDARSVTALDVVERHARGEASDEELASARGLAAAARGLAAAAKAAATANGGVAAWAAATASAAWAGAEAAVGSASVDARDAERAAQAEELRRICREIREDGR
jgi:hypothetical protein